MLAKKKSKGKAKAKPKPKSKARESKLQVSSAPVSIGVQITQGQPRLNGGKAFVVSHSEYLQDVVGTTDFTVTEYPINAGLADSFPWLGNIGALFEQYRFTKLRWRFEPSCSTATNGSVMMATDYDSQDASFTSKEVMASYPGYTKGPSYMRQLHDSRLGMGDYMKKYFTRYAAIPSGQDDRLYDVGSYQFATLGNSGVTVGELYVDYTVELYNPRIGNSLALNFATAWQVADSDAGTSVFPLEDPSFALLSIPWGKVYRALFGSRQRLVFPIEGLYDLSWTVYNMALGVIVTAWNNNYTDMVEIEGTPASAGDGGASAAYNTWVYALTSLATWYLHVQYASSTTYKFGCKYSTVPSGAGSNLLALAPRPGSRFSKLGLARLKKLFKVVPRVEPDGDMFVVVRDREERKQLSEQSLRGSDRPRLVADRDSWERV